MASHISGGRLILFKFASILKRSALEATATFSPAFLQTRTSSTAPGNASNPDGTKGEVLAILERAGGKLLASRPWQDSKLAYQIDGHRKGMYFLTYFSIDSDKLATRSHHCDTRAPANFHLRISK